MFFLATWFIYILVGSSSDRVKLIDLKSGSSTHELRGHVKSVLTCQWSSREPHILATGGADGQVILWDIRSSKSYLTSLGKTSHYAAHEGYVNGLTYTAGGETLISFSTNHKLKSWDTQTGRNNKVHFRKVPNKRAKTVQLSEGWGVVCVPSDSSIKCLDIKTGEVVNSLSGHYNSVNCCTLHPDYPELYSGGNDRVVLIWSAYRDAAYTQHLEINAKIKPNYKDDDWSSTDEDEG